MSYLKQKASPWVSFSVLAGGLASALILMFLVKVENNAQAINFAVDYEEYLEN